MYTERSIQFESIIVELLWVEVRPTGVRDGDQVLTTRGETSECQTTNANCTTAKNSTKSK